MYSKKNKLETKEEEDGKMNKEKRGETVNSIVQMAKEYEEFEKRQSELENTVKEKDEEIADLKKQLQELKDKVNELNNRIAEKDTSIANLQQQLNETTTQRHQIEENYNKVELELLQQKKEKAETSITNCKKKPEGFTFEEFEKVGKEKAELEKTAFELNRLNHKLGEELEKSHWAMYCCFAVVIGYVVIRCVSNQAVHLHYCMEL